MKSKKILVTGAAGFIGNAICEEANVRNIEVIALVNSNAVNCFGDRFETYKVDLLSDVDKLPKFQNIDLIVHTATANDKVSKDFNNGINLSLYGTKNILDFAQKNNIKNVIYFSTAQVYGQNLIGEINENSKINIETPYALNHFLGENLCNFYKNRYNQNIIISRPSNGFGCPNINKNKRSYLVPTCFVKSILENKKIILKSSGKQIRNFVDIRSIAKMTLDFINDFPKGINIINMGSNFNSNIIDVAKLVASLAEDSLQIKSDIKIESEFPLEENKFKYYSNFIDKFDSYEITKKRFKNVIINLLADKIDNS